VVVDPTTQQYGISRPDYAVVTDYPRHPINNGFSTVTLFPQAAGIERLPTFLNNEEEDTSEERTDNSESNDNQPNIQFDMTPFLLTVKRSWIETSPLKDTVHFSDLLDIIGPITIGMVLTREISSEINNKPADNQETATESLIQKQRIIVLGDGDFLSNTFLGNAGNLDMGMNIFNWLSHDEQFIAIPTRTKNDIILEISPTVLSLLGGFFLFILPGMLILTGSIIWFRRRNL